MGGLAIFINLGAEQLGAPSPISARLSVTTRTEWRGLVGPTPIPKGGLPERGHGTDPPHVSCRAPFSSPKVSIIPNPLASATRTVSLPHDHLFPVLVSRRLQLQQRSEPPLIPTTDSPTNGERASDKGFKVITTVPLPPPLRPSLLIKRSR